MGQRPVRTSPQCHKSGGNDAPRDDKAHKVGQQQHASEKERRLGGLEHSLAPGTRKPRRGKRQRTVLRQGNESTRTASLVARDGDGDGDGGVVVVVVVSAMLFVGFYATSEA